MVLNIISRQNNPKNGKITCDSVEVLKWESKQVFHLQFKEIGFKFQQKHIPPKGTSLENVLTPLLLRRVPHKKIERVKKCIINKKHETTVSAKVGVF